MELKVLKYTTRDFYFFPPCPQMKISIRLIEAGHQYSCKLKRFGGQNFKLSKWDKQRWPQVTPQSDRRLFSLWKPCHPTDSLKAELASPRLLWSPTLTPGGQQNTLILHREAPAARGWLPPPAQAADKSEQWRFHQTKKKKFFSCLSRFRCPVVLTQTNKQISLKIYMEEKINKYVLY